MPAVSVLMCTYNAGDYLSLAVGDILAQDFTDFELIICDDGSTDGTRERLRALATADGRVRLFLHETNLGYVRNKNFALANARGDFVTQMDQDDRCPPQRLAVQVGHARGGHQAIVTSACRRIDAGGRVWGRIGPAADELIAVPPLPGEDYPFWFPGLLASRAVFDAVGGWDLAFDRTFGDDLYWTIRANEHFPILCLAQPLYDYRDTPGSITSRLDDPRKLAASGLLDELRRLRHETGSDPVEQGDSEALETLRRTILTDRGYVAEQIRTFAARAIDEGRFGEAARLLMQSARRRPSRTQLRTAAYLLRQAASRLRAHR